MLLGILFFYTTLTAVASDVNKIESARSAKKLSFNSLPNDIGVSLDFSVPFIKIPLKENFPHNLLTGIPKINMDPKSLVFGGAMVVLTSLLASAFSKDLLPQYHNPYSRRDDNYRTDTIMDISKMLTSKSHSCPSRLACWVSKSSNEDTVAGWRQLTRNKILATFFNTTEVENAFRIGLYGGDCESFSPCPLNEEQFSNFVNNFIEYKRVNN